MHHMMDMMDMMDMTEIDLQTLEHVAIALKNPHGDMTLRALRGGMVRCSVRGKRNGAVESPPESINKTCQLLTKMIWKLSRSSLESAAAWARCQSL